MTSLKILVVDDEEIVRDTLKQLLDFLGCQVDCAENGNSGLQALEDRCYDVALVDIRMPNLNGMGFLRRSKEIRPNMPVIIITGHGSDSTRTEALAAGAFSFLQKPFRFSDIKELMDRVESASYSSP
jgi:DNA-binding NtrC family response regulator